MTITLRLVEAHDPEPRDETTLPPVDVASAVRSLKAADVLLVRLQAQTDDLRRVGQDQAARRMEAGALAKAQESLEAAERDLFAAPVRSIEDLAIKILIAAASEFECVEANDALRENAETILRSSATPDR